VELARLFERTRGEPVECSILFPVWNGAKFLDESLPSVLKQQQVRAEIIVSDDCSSDESLQKIMAIVSAYQGPHDVVVLKTSARAEFDHVPLLAREARSDALIQAHQDDIAYPQRSRVLVDGLRGSVRLVTSAADYRRDGRTYPAPARELERVRGFKTFEPYLYSGHDVLIGSRFVMHADLFRRFPRIERGYLTGGLDILLPIRAMILGEVTRVEKPLLAVGVHRERWSTRLWDRQNAETGVFGYAVRRLTVLDRAGRELEQARSEGLVDESRAALLAGWFERARARFVVELVRAREKLVNDGFELTWTPRPPS
jgi:hypothetical protein